MPRRGVLAHRGAGRLRVHRQAGLVGRDGKPGAGAGRAPRRRIARWREVTATTARNRFGGARCAASGAPAIRPTDRPTGDVRGPERRDTSMPANGTREGSSRGGVVLAAAGGTGATRSR